MCIFLRLHVYFLTSTSNHRPGNENIEYCDFADNYHILWNIIRISTVISKKIYVKMVLRRCSAQRARSAAAPPCGCCRACKTNCHTSIYPNLIYLRGPASAADPSPRVVQNHIKIRPWFLIDFLSQNWSKMEPFWESKSFQNRSKIWSLFWSIFRCDFDPKMVPKIAPKTIQNPLKIHPKLNLVRKTWFF